MLAQLGTVLPLTAGYVSIRSVGWAKRQQRGWVSRGSQMHAFGLLYCICTSCNARLHMSPPPLPTFPPSSHKKVADSANAEKSATCGYNTGVTYQWQQDDSVNLCARHDPVCMTAAAACRLQLCSCVYSSVSLVWLTAETRQCRPRVAHGAGGARS